MGTHKDNGKDGFDWGGLLGKVFFLSCWVISYFSFPLGEFILFGVCLYFVWDVVDEYISKIVDSDDSGVFNSSDDPD